MRFSYSQTLSYQGSWKRGHKIGERRATFGGLLQSNTHPKARLRAIFLLLWGFKWEFRPLISRQGRSCQRTVPTCGREKNSKTWENHQPTGQQLAWDTGNCGERRPHGGEGTVDNGLSFQCSTEEGLVMPEKIRIIWGWLPDLLVISKGRGRLLEEVGECTSWRL